MAERDTIPMVYQWALPENLDIPRDVLRCRLDFYQETVVLYILDKKVITTRVVSANDIVLALLSHVNLSSGLLPEGVLWWKQIKDSVEIALWRPPKVWPVALMTEAFEPPIRFKLPMPGLIFVCSPGRPPSIYASKRRPVKLSDKIYHAPLFNIFDHGGSCPGTHKYPLNIEEIPESFFLSFFTKEAQYRSRSKKHPEDLLKLWEEIDGKKKYPLKDLVLCGKVGDIIV